MYFTHIFMIYSHFFQIYHIPPVVPLHIPTGIPHLRNSGNTRTPELTFSLARCSRATKARGTDRFWAMVEGSLGD